MPALVSLMPACSHTRIEVHGQRGSRTGCMNVQGMAPLGLPAEPDFSLGQGQAREEEETYLPRSAM